MRRIARFSLLALTAALILPATATPALAAYPGENGLIVYVSNGGLYTTPAMSWNIDGEYLADGFEPSWSPDGQRIVFTRDGGVWVMNANATGQTRLTPGSGDSPSWSGDGTRIVYTAFDGLHVMDADGTDASFVHADAAAEDPAWSPVSNQIAFSALREGNREIVRVNADGTGELRLTTLAGADIDPDWSPDGLKIAFSSSWDGDAEIHTINPDGTGLRNLTDDSSGDFKPAWSPDGTEIAFTRGGQVYRMFADGTSQRIVIEYYGASRSSPDWQPAAEEVVREFFPPNTHVTRPRNGLSYYQANLRSITGTTNDIGEHGVEFGQVALRRVFTNGTCANWNGSKFVMASCKARLWNTAVGAPGWTYSISKLLTRSRGTNVKHYVVLARGIDRGGNIETNFVDGRNRNSFEVI